MAVTSVPTHREQPLVRPSRWQVGVRLCTAVFLLGSLVFPLAARAQLPAGSADPGPAAAPVAPDAPPIPAAAPVAVPPIPTISTLPAGLFTQARAGMLEFLIDEPTGGKRVVAQLSLLGTQFETLCIGGFLYVTRGAPEVVVMDVSDPRSPRMVSSFHAGGLVTALWGSGTSLMIGRSDGYTVLFDLSDPVHPRYQSLIAPAAPPVAPAYPTIALPQRARSIRKAEQSRLATSVRPFMFFANRQTRPTSYGTLIDFSYQYMQVNSLWWGIEIAPLIINSYYDGARANSRVWFGYAMDRFAIAITMGSGVTDDSTWLQLGAVARVGRFTGVHATLRLMASVMSPHDYPTSGEFNLEGPITRRLGLRYNFTGDSALLGFHTTLGLQVFTGRDPRWYSTVLTPGLGFIYMRTNASSGSAPNVHHPGVMFSFTVEPRW